MATLLVVVNAPDSPIGSADSEQRIANREVHIETARRSLLGAGRRAEPATPSR